MRHRFELPDNTVYLDGNSLGPPLKGTAAALNSRVLEWQHSLIAAWNEHGWIREPERIGDRIARLIGATAGSVTVGDTLSIRLYQVLSTAVSLQAKASPERRVVLTDNGNFPGDLYVAQGLMQTLGDGYQLRIVDPEQIPTAIDDSVAVVMLTEVDYRSARLHDMQAITATAHRHDALCVWDLAHSAGALPVNVTAAGADFAVGCTYKYLNGGPGAPAFLYANPGLDLGEARSALSGWLGHAEPFAFEQTYRAARGVSGFRVGTPSVLAMRVLDSALDVFDDVDMRVLAARSQALSQALIEGIRRCCPSLALASPEDALQRGSHVSFTCGKAYAVMQCLIREYRVIGDVRTPNLLRFGISPLYVDASDIERCVQAMAEVLEQRRWDRPEYHERNLVT